MTTNTENIVADHTHTVATAIRDTQVWDVYEANDGAGPYISLNNPLDIEDYRCISLTDEGACGDDLSKYRWNFWSHSANIYHESTLDSATKVEAVLHFLSECLGEEARVIAAMA